VLAEAHTILKWYITLGIIYVLQFSANIGPPDLCLRSCSKTL